MAVHHFNKTCSENLKHQQACSTFCCIHACKAWRKRFALSSKRLILHKPVRLMEGVL